MTVSTLPFISVIVCRALVQLVHGHFHAKYLKFLWVILYYVGVHLRFITKHIHVILYTRQNPFTNGLLVYFVINICERVDCEED